MVGYFAVRALIAVVLALAGWPGPDLPLPLLALALLDLPARWGVARWPIAGLGIVAVQLVASLTGLSSVGLADVVKAAAVVGPLLLLLVVVRRAGALRAAAIVGPLVLLPILTPPQVRAHDPGQGEEVATIGLEVMADGHGQLAVRVVDPMGARTDELSPVRLLAPPCGRSGRSAAHGYRGVPRRHRVAFGRLVVRLHGTEVGGACGRGMGTRGLRRPRCPI
ncbi:hypothetical protein [Saccharothrix sp. ALI-22-I]|uniref:hypothetical protein n=1 Tax=Saccharothrix sp. ALI-22-I TaxID=1933778 RepID=UPI0015C2F2AE|nr:hypothetical protein [Saccharothrix sp. ALI-22-I]